MELDEWNNKSCTASVGVGEDFATIYSMTSEEKGKGHGQELLLEMKKYYESQGKKFGSTIALSNAMKHLLVKYNIHEYTE